MREILQRVEAFLIQSGEFLFGGDLADEPLLYWQIAARSIAVYMIGLLLMRVGKSRLVGRITLIDVLVGFVLGSLLSRAITGDATITGTTVAAAAIVGIHWLFTAMACRWHWFGKLVKGHARLVVKDGQPLIAALRQSHLSDRDLMAELRLSGVESLSEVKLAYKERNGQISVIRNPSETHVVTNEIAPGVREIVIRIGPAATPSAQTNDSNL